MLKIDLLPYAANIKTAKSRNRHYVHNGGAEYGANTFVIICQQGGVDLNKELRAGNKESHKGAATNIVRQTHL